MEPSVQGEKRRRAQRACQFCHQRKMKCNNELPKCSNCVTHGQVCTYVQGPKKPRPSNDRISRLEEENRQLHASLAGESMKDYQQTPRSVRSTKTSLQRTPTEERPDQIGRSKHTSQDRSPSPVEVDVLEEAKNKFHGPASILFDEYAPTRKQATESSGGEHPLESLSSELMAQAAIQRQLESVHFANQQLDTDGIEQGLAEELLSLFWKTANSAFLVVYRPAFMRDWACGGAHYSKLLLNAIYFNAARHVSEDRIRRNSSIDVALDVRFLNRFKELLRERFDQSTITTVQALLVMSASVSALACGRSLGWLYAGLAYRMIVDLGLHTNKCCSSMSQQTSDEDIEIKRRVFWSAFLIDKLQSFYHGRPACLQEADTSVPLILRDHHDELEQWAPMEPSHVISGSYSPTYIVSNFSRLCRLGLIANNVLNEIYREKKKFENPNILLKSLRSLSRDLDDWHSTVPLHLRFSPASIEFNTVPVPSPHTYSATIMSYVLQILLHRPFVSEGHLQSTLPSVALDSFSSCVAAADTIAQFLDSFDRTHTFKKLPYALIYACYVSATIHVRIAAQKQLETNAYAYLRTCFKVFDLNAREMAVATKAKTVIQQLMVRMDVSLPDEGSHRPAEAKVRQDPTPGLNIATQVSNADKSILNNQNLDDSNGASQLQEWAFDDLDFDAVLQSFDQPSKMTDVNLTQNSSHQTTTRRGSEPHGENFDSSRGLLYQNNSMSNGMEDAFDLSSSNDVLFGFDIPGPEN